MHKHLDGCDVLSELAGCDLVLEHLVEFGGGSACNFGQDKVSDNTGDDTCGSEAIVIEVSYPMLAYMRTEPNLQESSSHTPNFEHQWDHVVESQAETERPHQRGRSSLCSKVLGRDLGNIRVCDSGATDDSEVGNTSEKDLQEYRCEFTNRHFSRGNNLPGHRRAHCFGNKSIPEYQWRGLPKPQSRTDTE